ncbi:MAG: dihydroorotate dehydrogenase electron transfer subunit [Candidatus Bathyarchaeia archaeon]|nr:dihydroorotate dehydrogenase electron transfer subunit [Candidatus Bathyarchaeota archaeon]
MNLKQWEKQDSSLKINYLKNEDALRIVKIRKVKKETPTVKTLTFYDEKCVSAKPGQFIMVWIPNIDEIPISIALTNEKGLITIAIKKVGEATEALHNLTPKDKIGIRGPYGTFFSNYLNEEVIIAAGGVGIAPLMTVIKDLATFKNKAKIIFGAENKRELLFLKLIEEIILNKPFLEFIPVTIDGSYGVKSDVVNILKEKLKGFKGQVLTCGPEPMIYKIFKLCIKKGIKLQASLERIMKCGIGVCGSCDLAGFRVCKDGPVFNIELLKRMSEELGVYKRDYSGNLIELT